MILLMMNTQVFAEDAAMIVDGLELAAMQRAADEMQTGISVRDTILDIISGETRLDGDFLMETWEKLRGQTLGKLRDVLVAFLSPMFLSALFSRLFPGNRNLCGLLGACCCTGVFIDVLLEAESVARRLITGIAGAMEAALPVLTTLSAMGGGTSSAALLTPAATLISEMMVSLLGDWGLAITCAAGICACACAIGSRFRVDGLFGLMKRTVQTGAGLMLALFAGILKVQGMLGASFDSAAVKTARFAVDKIVPVVGGGISDTMDAALSSIMLINSAVGVTGMLIVVTACAGPILELSAALIAVRLARAIAQPVEDGVLMDAAEKFGDVIRLFVVISITAVTLSLILTGAAIGAGRSIA